MGRTPDKARPRVITILHTTISCMKRFISTWRMPDQLTVSCCNEADCYATDAKYVDGAIYARRREDGKCIAVPSQR